MESPQKSQAIIRVKIFSDSNEAQTSGSVVLKHWEKKERTLRGIKALSISWGLALAAVLIPLLHFILVPLLLLAGPIAFFGAWKQEQVILGGKGQCPNCQKDFEIVRSEVKWPLTDLCNYCQASLKIDTVSESRSG